MNNYNSENNNLAIQAFIRLDQWLQNNGWEGYDPYDILGTPLFVYLQNLPAESTFYNKLRRKLFFRMNRSYPLFIRNLLRVQKTINPKALGLLASGYFNTYQISHNEHYLHEGLKCLEWLQVNSSKAYSGNSWGYPFDWQSRILIPKGTPSSVVSSIIGEAFWQAYQLLSEAKYLKVCENICDFFIKELNIDHIDSQTICFSYTPLDKFHVHNANLMVADFLVRVGNEIDNQRFVELGLNAANYALIEQNPDGSIYYWGKVQNQASPEHIDHYHSGFEMRSFYNLWRTTNNQRFYRALNDYFTFYEHHLLLQENDDYLPKLTPTRTYPVDIHTCAESIILNATISDYFPKAKIYLPGLVHWTVKHMQKKDGWFVYQYHENGGKTAIPYLRWGQAWMFLALSKYLKKINYNTITISDRKYKL